MSYHASPSETVAAVSPPTCRPLSRRPSPWQSSSGLLNITAGGADDAVGQQSDSAFADELSVSLGIGAAYTVPPASLAGRWRTAGGSHRPWWRMTGCVVCWLLATLILGVMLQYSTAGRSAGQPTVWPEWVPGQTKRPSWAREQEAAASLRAARMSNPYYWDTKAVWGKLTASSDWSAALSRAASTSSPIPALPESDEATHGPSISRQQQDEDSTTTSTLMLSISDNPNKLCGDDEGALADLVAHASPPEFPNVPSAYWGYDKSACVLLSTFRAAKSPAMSQLCSVSSRRASRLRCRLELCGAVQSQLAVEQLSVTGFRNVMSLYEAKLSMRIRDQASVS